MAEQQSAPLPSADRVFYHGTHARFERFEEQPGADEPGFFFTPNRDLAGKYGPNLIEAKLALANPYVYEDEGLTPREAKEAGYDSFVQGSDYYVVFSAAQIAVVRGQELQAEPDQPALAAARPPAGGAQQPEGPLVYHGTPESFERFDLDKSGSNYAYAEGGGLLHRPPLVGAVLRRPGRPG